MTTAHQETERTYAILELGRICTADHMQTCSSGREAAAIHDISGMPVVLIGMAGIEKRLATRKQLLGRISQWVEFQPCDVEDAATLARTVCEVGVDDELLAAVHTEARGSMRLMVVGLSRIEALGKAQGWSSVSAAQWGSRDFGERDHEYRVGDAPRVELAMVRASQVRTARGDAAALPLGLPAPKGGR